MAGLLFEGDITADDAFEWPTCVRRTAPPPQGFGAASSRLSMRWPRCCQWCSVFFPLVGDVRATAGADAGIIVVQLAEDGRGEFRPEDLLAQSALSEVAWLAQFGREVGGLRLTSTPMPRMKYLMWSARRSVR